MRIGHRARVMMSVLAAAILASAAPLRAQQTDAPPTRLLLVRAGQTTQTVTGTIRGRGESRYALAGRAGDRLDVRVTSPNRFLYFNVLGPGGDALYVGSGEANPGHASVRLPAAGRYTLVVYLMRNEARRGATARYQLTAALRRPR